MENNEKNNIIACICEGGFEEAIVTKLLGEGKLIFSREDLLENKIIKERSAKKFEERYLNKSFDEKIKIYRFLDSRKESFKLSKHYEQKIAVINVITAPEIEILVIINENKYADYSKTKSSELPSEYCKRKFGYSQVKKRDFISEYFSDVDNLVKVIKEYKRITQRNKDETTLADLLKL